VLLTVYQIVSIILKLYPSQK